MTMRRFRRFVELFLRLALARGKEARATVRRSVGARYRVRKPKPREWDTSGGYQPIYGPKNPAPPPKKL